MGEKQIPKMSDDFLHLCREIGLGEDQDFCKKRWAGVCAAAKGTTHENVEALIRVVFRSKQPPDKGLLQQVRQHFKSADELFPMSGNDRELEVLCAAILMTLLNGTDGIVPYTALAITTAAVNGCRTQVVSLDLIARAEESLVSCSQHIRRRPDFNEFQSATLPKINLAEVLNKLQAKKDFDGVAAAFNDAAAEVEKTLKSVYSRVLKAIENMNHFLSIQDEELQILWWLIGGRSWSVNKPFSEVTPGAQVLMFAKELSDFTNVCPGPESIKGVLSQAGLRKDRELTIHEAINACDQNWLSSLIKGGNISPVTLPLHFAVARKLETKDNVSWIKGWAAVADLDENRTLPALTLGELFYRERLEISLLEG